MIIGIVLQRTGTLDLSTINNLPYQLLFFVLGYMFYSSIFIGLGSIVGADHETGGLQVLDFSNLDDELPSDTLTEQAQLSPTEVYDEDSVCEFIL